MTTMPTQGLQYVASTNKLYWIAQIGVANTWGVESMLLTGADAGQFNLSPQPLATSFQAAFGDTNYNLNGVLVNAASSRGLFVIQKKGISDGGTRGYFTAGGPYANSGGGGPLNPITTAAVYSLDESFLYVTSLPGNAVTTWTLSSSTMNNFVSVNAPNGITIDLVGNIYVGTNGSNVVKVTPGGTVTNYSSNTFTTPCSMAYDNVTNMLAVGDGSTGTVYGVNPRGVSVTLATGIGTMSGIAAAAGKFYVYDSTNGIKVITMNY